MEVRFIEFKPGEKHAGKSADVSTTPDAFEDCGILLNDSDLVIDIDYIPKEAIRALIIKFNIKTQTVWTDRGAHLYFNKPRNFTRARNGVCALGFPIEQKTSTNTPRGLTVKRNGVLRTIENEGIKAECPWFFADKKKYNDLTGLGDGEGRNHSLFRHSVMLKEKHQDKVKILEFINQNLFSEPLSDEEFKTVSRPLDGCGNDSDSEEYEVAVELIKRFKCIKYLGDIWYWDEDRYEYDEDEFKRMVCNRLGGVKTYVIDETIKQINYRADTVDNKEEFPIRFKNGVLTDGQFIYFNDYSGFTPYYIDIEYDETAESVKCVDKYIENLTSGSEEYRRMLLEALAYPLITNAERMRSIGKFFIFRGNGANGKGTLLQIMKKIYNSRNCSSMSIKELVDPRYQVNLIGKLANLGDDIQPDPINNDEMKIIKNICTADTVEMRRLYHESESCTVTTKLFFTTNADIKTFEKGYAYKRRVLWLPMFNTVEKPDPNFISKMTSPEALKYWIKLIVEGYFRLYENRMFTECKEVTEYNEQYHRENNYMYEFLDQTDIEIEIIGKTGKEVKEAFDKWNDDDTRRYSPKLLREALKEMGIGKGHKKVSDTKSTKRVFLRQSETKQQLIF